MPIKLSYKPCEENSKYSAIDTIDIELHDEASVDDVLDAVQKFMQAIGFTLNGKIEVVSDEYQGD